MDEEVHIDQMHENSEHNHDFQLLPNLSRLSKSCSLYVYLSWCIYCVCLSLPIVCAYSIRRSSRGFLTISISLLFTPLLLAASCRERRRSES